MTIFDLLRVWGPGAEAAVQSGTVGRAGPKYADCVILKDGADTIARLQRIEQFIAEQREAKRRQLLRSTIKLWRKAQGDRKVSARISASTLLNLGNVG
ncbi:MAG TPA: hypothetical protein VNZ26_21735 [Vicinamibacterales bacterium]|nr:hypothetical protein [Vicinamibacterales bacterium]